MFELFWMRLDPVNIERAISGNVPSVAKNVIRRDASV